MKKLFSVLLTLALALSLAPMALAAEATPSDRTLKVDGVTADVTAYNIGGCHYFRIRDLAALLSGTESSFSVEWDAAENVVRIETGADYAGTEPEDAAEDQADSAVESTQSVLIDGAEVDGLSVWNIGGSNYFRLAELQDSLGYALRYDESTRTIYLQTGAAAQMTFAADYAEIYQALVAAQTDSDGYSVAGLARAETADSAAGSAGNSADASGTNVQVEGIDEGDIVKTDGTYIYVIDGDDALTILRADGGESTVVSVTEVADSAYESRETGSYSSCSGISKTPREMFVREGTLALISDCYRYESYEDADGYVYDSDRYICVDFYDVSDPAKPELTASLGQDGRLVASRMNNGCVCLVSSYSVYDYDVDDPESYVPRLYHEGEGTAIPAGSVYICPEIESGQYTLVCCYDLSDRTQRAAQALLGGGDTVYMSDGSLYVFHSVWTTETPGSSTESDHTESGYITSADTEIYRFRISDGLTLAAHGSVPGFLDSQFSADEYNGYLRVVTTENEYANLFYPERSGRSSNGLYVLDAENLYLVGSLSGLAEGESVKSVRFDAETAWFCTYEVVDPLFAVDVSDPANPTVLSALKISGFSEYLHRWTEERLFGFGLETDGDSGRSTGLKLVMFNTADRADVTEENSYLLSGVTFSEALYEHKALFIDVEENLVGFLAGSSDYYIFSYSVDGGFSVQMHLQVDGGAGQVRGLRVGEYIYIVSGAQATVVDTDAWNAVATVAFSTSSASDGIQK
ncbi:MAG: beta-propeller domain-containing protein [Oscillospiraceae bacterium]|nr:beta-propeller domain-containing protein [Oscillospiraceae bacterium]